MISYKTNKGISYFTDSPANLGGFKNLHDALEWSTSREQTPRYTSVVVRPLLTYYGKGTDKVPTMLVMTKAQELAAWKARKRSPRAREKLVRKYICYAFKLASRFTGPRLEHDEAVGAANAGMMEAMERFNPNGGAHFTTFSAVFIRRHLINALVSTYCVHVSDHVRKKFALALKTNKKLLHKDGDPKSIEEVFSRLSAGTDTDISGMTEKAPDAPASPYEATSPAEDAETASLPQEVREGLATLSPIERKVMKARYYVSPPESFDALGRRLGKTKVFLREVHDEALVKLRRYMQK